MVTPTQDSNNPRQLDVTISTPVQTFFARVLGINSFNATRSAKAIYVQPVPMGSPLAYYGVGCLDTKSGVATAPDSRGEPACTTAGNSTGASGVPNATAGSNLTGAGAPSQLNSQGAWGVVFTRGGDSRNGDAFSPLRVSQRAHGWGPNAGPSGGGYDPYGGYDPAGYNYGIDIPGGGGSVSVFDPIFCGMPVLGHGRQVPATSGREPPRGRPTQVRSRRTTTCGRWSFLASIRPTRWCTRRASCSRTASTTTTSPTSTRAPGMEAVCRNTRRTARPSSIAIRLRIPPIRTI